MSFIEKITFSGGNNVKKDYEYSSDGKIHDKERLKELQALPLWRKIQVTQARIIEWYNYFDGQVYISFSGGKDSTVLLHIARKIFPDIPVAFSNAGLEYPEIQSFAKLQGAQFVYPKMKFTDIIKTYGYPIISKEVSEAIYYARRINSRGRVHGSNSNFWKTPIRKQKELLGKRIDTHYSKQLSSEDASGGSSDGKSKSHYNKEKWLPIARDMPFLVSHYCCNVMKKSPLGIYQREHKQNPILVTMAEESRMRKQAWIRHGCNAFDSKKKTSQPMSFWTEQDVLEYIQHYQIDICSVYGDIEQIENSKLYCTGCQRTCCIFCAYGLHLEKGETRFQRLKKTHPKQYNYCIGGGEWNDNPFYDPNASTEPDEIGWANWNPKKIWTPSKDGLGMGKVFDMLNEVYGDGFVRYK